MNLEDPIAAYDAESNMEAILKAIKSKKIPINPAIVISNKPDARGLSIAKKLGIEDTVEFLGFVPDLSKIMKNAEIFVQPSLQEGSGSISVFEAMLSGIPVITTQCDGLPEDIEKSPCNCST